MKPFAACAAANCLTVLPPLTRVSFALSTDVILADAGDRLVIRHEAGSSADPYVAGTLLAIRRVPEVTGVLRGLDRLLFGSD